jgi:hypothetical protein
VFVGSYLWELVPHLEIKAWRTFDGIFTVAFGFVLTIGVTLLIANVASKVIIAHAAGKWNPSGFDWGHDARAKQRPKARSR